MSNPSYASYIGSPAWRTKRRERLALDKGRCVVCGARAVNVHHLTYRNLGNEDARRELVSVCRVCHKLMDAIERAERLERRSTKQEGKMGKPGVFRGWLDWRVLVVLALVTALLLALVMVDGVGAQARTPGAFSGGPRMGQAAQRLPSGWRQVNPPDRRGANGDYSPAGRTGRAARGR